MYNLSTTCCLFVTVAALAPSLGLFVTATHAEAEVHAGGTLVSSTPQALMPADESSSGFHETAGADVGGTQRLPSGVSAKPAEVDPWKQDASRGYKVFFESFSAIKYAFEYIYGPSIGFFLAILYAMRRIYSKISGAYTGMMDKIESSSTQVQNDLTTKLTTLRGDMTTGLAAVRGDMTTGLEAVRGEIAALRGDMTTGLEAVRGDMTTRLAAVRGDMKNGLEAVRGDMTTRLEAVRGEMATVRTEMLNVRRDMASGLESVRASIGQVQQAQTQVLLRFLPALPEAGAALSPTSAVLSQASNASYHEGIAST